MTSLLQQQTDDRFQKALHFLGQGWTAKAALIYRGLLQDYPDNALCWFNMGAALYHQGHFNASLICSERALELTPDNPAFLASYGKCLTSLDRKDEALRTLATAIQNYPNNFFIQKNYALALREFGKSEEALKYFDAALALKPGDVDTQWLRAIAYLDIGKFEEGWKAFEIRWKLKRLKPRPFNVPRWQGEDLIGKTILVHEEQGFGDTILSSRYIPLIKARGGKVILECKKPLHRLFQSVQDIDKIFEPGVCRDPFDYHVPIMSLPGIFKTDINSIPTPVDFYIPKALPVEAERLLKLAGNRLKVGIVWSGRVTFERNHRRAVSAARFLPLAESPNVQLYSLQKGGPERELSTCGAQGLIPELGPHLNDFADTAAVLKNLDLIIMTDSSVAHLAGSIGCPVWNLLNFRPYWLYLSEREDSPWYASMSLFRQPEPGNWDAVFTKVSTELKKLAQKKTL